MYDMKREKNLLSWVENDKLMSAAEMEAFSSKFGGKGYVASAEDRGYPLHDIDYFPSKWLETGPVHHFSGSARPGEYYAMQLAVYPCKGTKGDISVDWSGNFKQPDCFNFGGVDDTGLEFKKAVHARESYVQPLWFGFDIPEEYNGNIEGQLTVKIDGEDGTDISVKIQVEGDVLEDRGDSEPWRHSRLRWLNSDIAIDDKLTAPFIPLVVRKNTIKCLGREVTLGCDGLPVSIISKFASTNEYISRNGKEILSGPVSLEVKPNCVLAPKKNFEFTKIEDGVVEWQCEFGSSNITVLLKGRMEYDGYIEYICDVTALSDITVDDISLNIPYSKDASNYWMGLGKQGGFREPALDWKWDPKYNQDTMWMGDVNAGLMIRLKDNTYEKPFMLIYYHYKPLMIPDAWNNEGKGGCRVSENNLETVLFSAYSGKRTLSKGQKLDFRFDLCVTPIKPIDKNEHWNDHYYHSVPNSFKEVTGKNANIINLHHANELNPFINYPFFETEDLSDFVEKSHENGLRTKLYYTVKEITIRTMEFWAFQSLGDEIIPSTYEKGLSFQGSLPYADDWMNKYIKSDYLTAWRQKVNRGKYHDEMEASVVAAPSSRFNNYFLEGLQWILDNTNMDGLYFDDVAFDRSIMKRIRKILDRHHPGCAIDLHSWNYFKDNNVDDTSLAGYGNSMNLYIDNFAFIDRIWFGEGFDYDFAPDHWLIEVSGIPFGMLGEMLQNGGNVWRGMLYGMSNRSGSSQDPSDLWRFWNDFMMPNAVMLGYWNPACPVKTNNEEILATVFQRGAECLICLASWADKDVSVTLDIDYTALDIDKSKAEFIVSEVKDFQGKADFSPDKPITVPAGKGWMIILKEKE